MDEVKKNAYWIACGVVALLAGVFYVVAVAQGTNAEIDKQTRKLKAQVAELQKFANIPADEVAKPDAELPMPVEEIAKYWQTRRESLQNELDEILKKYRSRDREFERLFRANAKNEVDYTTFVTEGLRKNLKELRDKHKALFTGPGGAEKAIPIEEPKDTDGDAGKARAQKQYNIAKAVVEATA